ncbi:MAG: aminopeptidase N [Anaerolineaceae bacterium]
MNTPNAARDVLTQSEAEIRAALVSNTAYVLDIGLVRGAETYHGDVTVTFDLSTVTDTFFDFRGKTIESLEVNGEQLEPSRTEFRLNLPGSALAKRNTVRVVYENEYDHGGDGFHQFQDPEDGQEYLYSNFEPYEAHRLFPCFDQPDIKATYALTVTAPTEWEVIGNNAEASRATLGDGRIRHVFEPTKKFSTYLFALLAGPYHAVHEMHGEVNLGLYCRKSLAKHLDTDELFTVSRQGLDFFGSFFDRPYEFRKYDQIFVPEFNSGAMENVGAVTHNEYMVFRDPPTDNQRRGRAETVLHEMAHMWFGDLVTMRWWNDLWLNESFATYMAYLCLDEATRFTTGWQDFNAGIKNWAYRQDQLVTTHPIAGEVADTDATFLNFDGITYGKGASVLKQLVAAIGMEGFREGMRNYFRTYSFGNATLSQFLGSLEAGSGADLKEWSRLWLETSSLNTIGSRWESDGDRITSFTLTQSAPADYAFLRPHRLDIGLVRDDGGSLHVDVLPATIAGPELELDAARGLPRPALVFPNYNDHGYAKVALDGESVRFVRENIERIDDVLLRQLLWSSLWNMVRDQQLKSTDYLALVREKILLEPLTELIDSVLSNASAALGRYVPEAQKDGQSQLFVQFAWEALQRAKDEDAKIIWARTLIGNALTPEDIALTVRLADGVESVRGLTIDQDMRWAIAAKCVANEIDGADARVSRELESDPTDRGQRAKIRCDVSVPDPEVKSIAWTRINGEGYGSLYLTVAAMSGFNWRSQAALLEPYTEQFFDRLPLVFRARDKEFAGDYFRSLLPSHRVEQAVLDRSERLLASLDESEPSLIRMLREANDDLARSIRCRRFAGS